MMIEANTVTLIAAIGTPVGLIAVASINYWTSIRAAKDARAAQAAAAAAQAAVEMASHAAQHATVVAASDASQAREQVANLTERQGIAARETSAALGDLLDTTHVIHTIVNSQHSKLLQLIARLTARVARDNPEDDQAQNDAKEALDAVGGTLHGTQVQDLDLTKGMKRGVGNVDLSKA